MNETQFSELDPKEQKHYRFLSKADNFGLIYGMSALGFKDYSKNEYGIEMTLEEATESRNNYFKANPNSENPKKRASQAEKFSMTYGSAFTKVKVFTPDAYTMNESEGTPPRQSWKFGEFIANPNGMKFYVPVIPVDEDNQPKVQRPILLEVKANLLEKGRRKGTATEVEGRHFDTKHNPFIEIVYRKEEGGKPVAPEKVWTVRSSEAIQEQFNSNLDEDEIPPHSWQNGRWEAMWDKHLESPY